MRKGGKGEIEETGAVKVRGGRGRGEKVMFVNGDFFFHYLHGRLRKGKNA